MNCLTAEFHALTDFRQSITAIDIGINIAIPPLLGLTDLVLKKIKHKNKGKRWESRSVSPFLRREVGLAVPMSIGEIAGGRGLFFCHPERIRLERSSRGIPSRPSITFKRFLRSAQPSPLRYEDFSSVGMTKAPFFLSNKFNSSTPAYPMANATIIAHIMPSILICKE